MCIECVFVCGVCMLGDGSTLASETVRSLLGKECEERLKKTVCLQKKGAFVEVEVKVKSKPSHSITEVKVL